MLVLIISTICSVHAQWRNVDIKGNTIELTYNFPELTIESDTQNPEISKISLPKCNNTLAEGYPSVPTIYETFEVPTGYDISDVSFIVNKIDTIYQKCARTNFADEALIQRADVHEIVPTEAIWPKEFVSFAGIQIYRDAKLASIFVNPVKVDIANDLLYFASEFIVSVNLTESIMPYTEAYDEIHSIDDSMLKNMLTLPIYNERNIELLNPAMQPPVLAPYYLIICPESFKSEAENFAEWKRRLGFNVIIESINPEANLLDPNFTKNIIQEYYDSNKKLEYVLLLGGANKIMPFKSKDKGLFSTSYYTDYYFGLMDGENDRLQDLVLGRIPARTVDEAKIMLEKSINYEKNPPLDEEDFFNTGIHIAEWGKKEGATNTDTHNFIWASEHIRDMMINQGFDINRIYYADTPSKPMYYKDGSLLPSDLLNSTFNWHHTKNDISNAINKGAWYVLCRSHALANAWTNMWFMTSDAATLTNGNKLPVVFSVNCESGAFYAPDIISPNKYSISQALLSNRSGGAVAVIGANHQSHTQMNDLLAGGLFEGMYTGTLIDFTIPEANGNLWNSSKPEMIELGKIFGVGVYWMLAEAEYPEVEVFSYKYARYNTEIYHCLGDPALNVYRRKPINKDIDLILEGDPNCKDTDNRMLVLVYPDENKTYIHNDNHRWVHARNFHYNKMPGLNLLCSIVGRGYVPVLMEDIPTVYNEEIYSQATIKSTDINNDNMLVDYNLEDSNTSIIANVYDIYGNKIYSVKGDDSQIIIPIKSKGISYITVEADGSIILSKKIMK